MAGTKAGAAKTRAVRKARGTTGGGRGPKLTAELRTQLVETIRVGTPLKTALGFVGLTDEVVYAWRNKAEAGKKVKFPSKELQSFMDFFSEVDKALQESHVRAQNTVHTLMTRAITEDTTPEQQRVILQAAQFHLTHRLPSEYNTKTTTELTGAEGGPLFIDGKAALALLREVGEADDDEE
jgi:transposase-like protein